MRPGTLDTTLAFTALLDLSPGYGHLDRRAAADECEALLSAWYRQHDELDLYAFARRWVQARDNAGERQLAAEYREAQLQDPALVGDPRQAHRFGWLQGRWAGRHEMHQGDCLNCPYCIAERLYGTWGSEAQAVQAAATPELPLPTREDRTS